MLKVIIKFHLEILKLMVTCRHRWARLLKQQSSITICRLPTKKNKLPFSASVCRKQMEVCHFPLLIAANKRQPFSVTSVFRLRNSGNMETWRHGNIETWKHGNMETWRHRYGEIDMETFKQGEMETWRHGEMSMEF